jgi:hypothetical protein
VNGKSTLQPPGQARGQAPGQARGQAPGQARGQAPDQARGQAPDQARGQRRIDKAFCLTITSAAMATAFPINFLHTQNLRDLCVALSLIATGGMLSREFRVGFCLPRFIFILADGLALALIWWQPIIGIAVYSVNHWVVAIGLSSHVYSARCLRFRTGAWLYTLAMLMAGAIGFLWLIPTPNGTLLRVVIPVVVSARLGFGFVHFLYDRWVWKMADPRVRATIGRDLFEPAWRTTAARSN